LNISFADSLPLDKPIKNPLDFHRKELILPTPPDKLHAPLYNLDSLTAATQKQIHH
ncbi:TPA: M protein trans-acting positive regulator, partial [Streptococcus pyogenes]